MTLEEMLLALINASQARQELGLGGVGARSRFAGFMLSSNNSRNRSASSFRWRERTAEKIAPLRKAAFVKAVGPIIRAFRYHGGTTIKVPPVTGE